MMNYNSQCNISCGYCGVSSNHQYLEANDDDNEWEVPAHQAFKEAIQDYDKEEDDRSLEVMLSGKNYLEAVAKNFSQEELDVLFDMEHVDDALFVLYQATFAKCGDEIPEFDMDSHPNFTGNMKLMLRFAFTIGWYTHEVNEAVLKD